MPTAVEARRDEPVVAPGPLPRRLWLATLALGALLWARRRRLTYCCSVTV